MNLPTFVMLNRSELLLWLPVNNGMSKGGMSRISELIIPSNSRGEEEEGEEESSESDASEILLLDNRVIVAVVIMNNIMRIIKN